MPLPSLPTDKFRVQHGAQSATFTAPPMDGTIAMPQIVDWHMQKSGDHVWAVYEKEDGGDDLFEISYRHLGQCVHAYSRKLTKRIGDKPGTVVAVLATIDTLSYQALMMSILRAGYCAFLISTRNSLPAVLHLLSKTSCQYVVSGTNDEHEKLLLKGIRDEQPSIDVIQAPLYAEILSPVADFKPLEPMPLPPLDRPAVIIHSSGTTNFPKPIPLTHISLLGWMRSLYYADHDLCGHRFSLQPAPPFHGMGFIYGSSNPLACGASVAAFPPRDPPTIPTPDKVLASWRKTKVDYGTGPPVNYIQWSQEPESVAFLKTMFICRSGSGPLPTAVGDYLVSQGVPLLNGYGCTEVIASLSNSAPNPTYGKDWEYISLADYTDPIFIPQDDVGQYYELAFRANEYYVPSVFTDKEKRVYETSDMVEFHPTRKGFFRLVGRVDDQLMLSTGEKTNPGPMELMIRSHPAIKNAIYFGRGRFNNGVLVQPADKFAFDPKDEAKLAEYRNLIWPVIVQANDFAPTHSRVFKELLLITSPDKPILLTPKGTVRRPPTLLAYEAEIDEIYRRSEEAADTSIAAPTEWTKESMLRYVEGITTEVMRPDNGGKLDAERDLFDQGCDSLQATFIKNRLTSGMRSRDINTKSLPLNLIYLYPSIAALSTFLSSFVSAPQVDTSTAPKVDRAARAKELDLETARFTADLPRHSGTRAAPTKRGVIITGTTGTLGSYLLDVFAKAADTGVVYAINRPSKAGDNEKRVREALADRGVDLALLDSGRVKLVEADMSRPDFGVAPELFEEMKQSVTVIVANAYRLDFMLGLKSFEPNIKTMRNLVDFALSSPFKEIPKLLNTSSMSTVSFAETVPVVEDTSPTGDNAPTGYGESKLICERIIEAAVRERGLPGCNIRIGQLSGSHANGSWNVSDWLPLLLQSAPSCKCLPEGNAPITWLPTDSAARAIYDFSTSTTLPAHCHLAHPKPTTWKPFIDYFAQQLGVAVVSRERWLAAMARTDITQNAALKLHAYFSARPIDPQNGREVLGLPSLQTKRSCEASETMRSLAPLNEGDFELWLTYWRSHGAFA